MLYNASLNVIDFTALSQVWKSIRNPNKKRFRSFFKMISVSFFSTASHFDFWHIVHEKKITSILVCRIKFYVKFSLGKEMTNILMKNSIHTNFSRNEELHWSNIFMRTVLNSEKMTESRKFEKTNNRAICWKRWMFLIFIFLLLDFFSFFTTM